MQVAEVADQHGAGEKMVDRNIEEALNLRGVQVDQQRAVGAGGGEQVGDQLRRDGHAGAVFAVLPRVAVVRNDHRDAAGGGALERVHHDQQFHQVLVDRVSMWAGRETHPHHAHFQGAESGPPRRRSAVSRVSPRGTPRNLQISSESGRFADPEKILKRLSSLRREERFFSLAAFAPGAEAAGVSTNSAACFGWPRRRAH